MKAAVALAAAVVVVTGCARLPPVSTSDDAAAAGLYRARAESLSAINAWELRGRIAVSIPRDVSNGDRSNGSGRRGGQAQFHWARSGADQTITLSGPFNRGALRVETDARGARAHYPNGETRNAPNVETLVEQETGWPLPVSALDYWLLGLAVPNQPAERELDANGRLVTLDQAGWHVAYDAYQQDANQENPPLPRRLDLARPASGAATTATLTVRIAIDEFKTRFVAPANTDSSTNPGR